eukprot:TRINITY_DN2956_c0_g1_i3.p1 TRINITY_DN2956_c0_g1~~TRINITY_DN2956_c0_g1_i3.p1  ORF type:complete len:181 (+),score=80.26 TRINITY_DN2956_c0_g1_i3:477-1019(+)
MTVEQLQKQKDEKKEKMDMEIKLSRTRGFNEDEIDYLAKLEYEQKMELLKKEEEELKTLRLFQEARSSVVVEAAQEAGSLTQEEIEQVKQRFSKIKTLKPKRKTKLTPLRVVPIITKEKTSESPVSTSTPLPQPEKKESTTPIVSGKEEQQSKDEIKQKEEPSALASLISYGSYSDDDSE